MVCHEVVLMIEYQGFDMLGWGLRWCVVGGLIRGLDMVGNVPNPARNLNNYHCFIL